MTGGRGCESGGICAQQNLMVVTHCDKPMARIGKEMINKKVTVKIYEDGINVLYEKVESSTRAGIDVPLPTCTNWAVEDVKSWFTTHATAANSGKAVNFEADLLHKISTVSSRHFLKSCITIPAVTRTCSMKFSVI